MICFLQYYFLHEWMVVQCFWNVFMASLASNDICCLVYYVPIMGQLYISWAYCYGFFCIRPIYGPTIHFMSQLYRLRAWESTVCLYGYPFMGQLFLLLLMNVPCVITHKFWFSMILNLNLLWTLISDHDYESVSVSYWILIFVTAMDNVH